MLFSSSRFFDSDTPALSRSRRILDLLHRHNFHVYTNSGETSLILQACQSYPRKASMASVRYLPVVSSPLDKNASLLLTVASSHVFLAASSVCVKWLSGLDESVPFLVVRQLRLRLRSVHSMTLYEHRGDLDLFPAL